MPELKNERWEKYARLRATGKTSAEAWMLAGYNAKGNLQAGRNGRLLNSKPEVKGRIVELIDEIHLNVTKRAEVGREWILSQLKDTADRCKQQKEVLDRKGHPTGEWRFDAAGANKAHELIGKELGMFKEQFRLESLDDELKGMSGPELRTFLKAACIEVGLRVVEMSDDDFRTLIVRHAPRLGFRIEACEPDSDSAEDAEAGTLRGVPEAGRVPPKRTH